ncbi:hypothetical protein BGX31_001031 [Mortierella sp. GBA43]|nr:hypothetical protein BGX31_001031 [Mortierella sp. GBA43]
MNKNSQPSMSDPDHSQEQFPQDHEQDYNEEEDEEDDWSDHDYYDPQDDLAYYHDQRLLIEESWLEWERQHSVNNRQSDGSLNLALFQKPGSVKRRERRQRSAQALWNARANGRSILDANSSSSSAPGLGSGMSEVDPGSPEKHRRPGSHRIISGWEATLAAREERLAAKTRLRNSGLEPRSWRSEYIKRTRLVHRWEKSRGLNVLIDPRIGRITNLWAEDDNRQNEGWFLAGGRSDGALVRCSPSAGKVQKDVVFRMDHLIASETSVMAIDRHRVIWGLSNGQVAITTLTHTGSGQTFQTFAGFHHGPVSCIKLVRDHLEFVLTGGVDGIVRLWNVETGRCVREFETQPGHAVKISHICCEPGSCIVAGASTGEIYVWKVNVNAIVAGRSEDVSSSEVVTPGSTDSPDRLAKVIKLPEEFQGVRYLEIDCGVNRSGLILAQATDGNVLHLYSLDTLTHLATLKSPVHGTPISAVYWSVPKYERSIISTSNGPSNGATHSLHKRHDKSSLIATGDHAGNVCLWYLSESMRRRMIGKNDHTLHPNQVPHDPQILEPNFALKAHDTKVTSLFVDALVIITGCMDGSAMAWNSVNGELLTVLNTGNIRGREMNGQNDLAVKCLVVNSLQYRGVMSIGNLVRSWDFSPEAAFAKDKNRKPAAKRAIQYSAGPKNRIESDIRNSLKESASLRRLEALAKGKREQLHRRYNNLEASNMADMTDEEVVEYVLMLSKQDDQNDLEAEQLAREIQLIQQMEDELLEEQQGTYSVLGNGEGSSSLSRSTRSSTAIGDRDEEVTEQELAEEEELVRRAIEMSLLDSDPSEDVHQAQEEDIQGLHNHDYRPSVWEVDQVVDVDVFQRDEGEKREDEQIVQSILRELEDNGTPGQGSIDGKDDGSKVWPLINGASTSAAVAPSPAVTPSPKDTPASGTPKMSWSMVARTHTESPASGQQPAIIKQYPQSSSQEDIEDEDTQLARILSLSMVEK